MEGIEITPDSKLLSLNYEKELCYTTWDDSLTDLTQATSKDPESDFITLLSINIQTIQMAHPSYERSSLVHAWGYALLLTAYSDLIFFILSTIYFIETQEMSDYLETCSFFYFLFRMGIHLALAYHLLKRASSLVESDSKHLMWITTAGELSILVINLVYLVFWVKEGNAIRVPVEMLIYESGIALTLLLTVLYFYKDVKRNRYWSPEESAYFIQDEGYKHPLYGQALLLRKTGFALLVTGTLYIMEFVLSCATSGLDPWKSSYIFYVMLFRGPLYLFMGTLFHNYPLRLTVRGAWITFLVGLLGVILANFGGILVFTMSVLDGRGVLGRPQIIFPIQELFIESSIGVWIIWAISRFFYKITRKRRWNY